MPINLAFIATLLASLFFPSIGNILWAPFLVYTFYTKPKIPSLWWSVAAGLISDFLAPHIIFGLISFVYTITTVILYDKKQHFFIDSLSTFPIMTFIYASLSTLFLGLFLKIPFSLSWVMADLILMPLAASMIAFIFYTLPKWVFFPKRRRGEEYFR